MEYELLEDAVALRGRSLAPLVKCPDCGAWMVKGPKGWRVCPDEECSLIRKRGRQRGRPEKVEREARSRVKPLSEEELRLLLEPYMTPIVLEQLRAHASITA